MGEDVAGARVPRRDRLPGAGGVDAVPREARLQPGGVRLHDVHRQLGPAARRGGRAHRRGEPERRRGAVRQSELRGPHPPAGPCELPRLTPARGGVRARRQDRLRPHDRTTRGGRRRAGVPAGPVAEPGGGGRGDRRSGLGGPVRAPVRADLGRRRTLGGAADADRAGLRVGRGLHVRARTAVLLRDGRRLSSWRRCVGGRPDRGRTDRGRPDPRLGRGLDHDRPHLTGGSDPAGLARRPISPRTRRRATGLQLLRGATREPRGDDARDLRERAAPQRARSGDRGPVDDPPRRAER